MKKTGLHDSCCDSCGHLLLFRKGPIITAVRITLSGKNQLSISNDFLKNLIEKIVLEKIISAFD